MTVAIGLLRGINVGGNNKLPMVELKQMLAEIGCDGCQTYIQSGNFVCRTESPEAIWQNLNTAIKRRFGMDIAVVMRTKEEWAEIIANNPFADSDIDPKHRMLMLAQQPISPEGVAQVVANYPGPERIVLVDQSLYITFPDGIGDSKLHAFPSWKRLTQSCTGRNWNTVLKLEELASQLV